MSKNIKMHPKYGVNPTIDICFFCEKERGIALLGAAYKGEAPRKMILDYEPCDECKKMMEKGVTIIEVRDDPKSKKLKLNDRFVPTGFWWVVTKEFIERNFPTNYQNHPVILMEEDVTVKLGLHQENCA